MNTLEITVPFPDKRLSPNARSHWAARARAVRAARRAAGYLALEALAGGDRPGWASATVRATFYCQTSHARDADNLMASLKPTLDGLQDAGVIANDSGLTPLPPVIAVDRLNPRVELVIERVDSTSTPIYSNSIRVVADNRAEVEK